MFYFAKPIINGKRKRQITEYIGKFRSFYDIIKAETDKFSDLLWQFLDELCRCNECKQSKSEGRFI
ncbi:hypothetical protein J32TS6_17410 [Virgibacillus pantothenticus]|nr:hypothetical protein J32TS6_17410 [Virgibacillus pantothenticus]